MIPTLISKYSRHYEKILPTGSRVICSPPPKDTDEDYIVYAPNFSHNMVGSMLNDGWEIGGSMWISSLDGGPAVLNDEHTYKEDGSIDMSLVFHSLKKFEDGVLYNVLVTRNERYFDDFTRATFLAKALNLQKRKDRVTLFKALCEEVWPDGKEKD